MVDMEDGIVQECNQLDFDVVENKLLDVLAQIKLLL
jgi:hypothetical protein